MNLRDAEPKLGGFMLPLPEALQRPDAYPDPVDRIVTIETHISWVFLTGQWAYKVKKPVANSFLDYSTLDRRQHYCQSELELNRRWAPKLYDSVVPIYRTDRGLTLTGPGQIVEYAVRMKQFPQESLLLVMIRRGALTRAHIECLARELAAIHHAAPRMQVDQPWATPERVQADAMDNFRDLAKTLPLGFHPTIRKLSGWTEAELARLKHHLENRRSSGMIRQCHGDLHLGNLIWLDGAVQLFDGIEFNDDYSWIDVASDLAFTLMDLEDHGRWDLANQLLNDYLEHSGDYDALRLVRFYKVYRAMVRAKTSALNATQHAEGEPARHASLEQSRSYLEYASSLLQVREPWLVWTFGPSGSGKSHGTRQLLDFPDTIRLRSDVERKRGHRGEDAGTALYSDLDTHRTYERLAQLASMILPWGYRTIVDATFLKRWQREQMMAVAERLGVQWCLVPFDADPETLRSRIRARREAASDVSDATEEVLKGQMRGIEPLADQERGHCCTIETLAQRWRIAP
jgi:hypothetical protein